MKQYVIGLDIGTTCTKAIVVDETGMIAGQGSSGYGLITVGDGIEQNAQDWITASGIAIRQAISDIDPNAVRGISCSTQGGSTVAVRKDGSFIGNAWTWMDKRSTKQADYIRDELGEDYVYHATGSRISTALDAAKIRNMKEDPEYCDASCYYTTLEVINNWMTGRAVIDPSNAAMRQLYNIDDQCWDEKILEATGVTTNELPEILPAGAFVGQLAADAAAATGLPEGIPVFNGAHDQYCASIGAGAVCEGDMLLSAGTTWVLMGITKKPLYTNSYIVPGRHPIMGLYGALVSLVGSGASMQWFNNQFMDVDFDEMNRLVPERMEQTKDLFVYPYPAGAPFPIHNKDAKAAFIGLTLEHDQFDLARALMEGVAFGVRRAADEFQKNGSPIQSISMMGGASKSPVWIQMIASASGIPIKQLQCSDACAMGAAMIAACALGFYPDYTSAAEKMVCVKKVFTPEPDEIKWYDDKFCKFDKLWNKLDSFYKGE